MTDELPKKLEQPEPKDVLPDVPSTVPVLPSTIAAKTEPLEHDTPRISFLELVSSFVQSYARNYIANLFQLKGSSGMSYDLKATLTGIVGGIVVLLTQVFHIGVPDWLTGTIVAILVVVFGYFTNKTDKA